MEGAPEGAGSEGEAAARVDLDQALAMLAPAERVCVTLCYGAGFSHAEAAEALEMPLGTVKSHVKRGLDKLRLQLAPPSLGRGGEGRDRAHV
jgi:RNA polymerase sigma-70 factor (ECF subfamily)